MTKPHLYLKYGVWCCVSQHCGASLFTLGYGYTARSAYLDWKAQT